MVFFPFLYTFGALWDERRMSNGRGKPIPPLRKTKETGDSRSPVPFYLLRNTDKSALECSCECGYTSLRSFNRNFKAIIGTSPTDYRVRRDS